MVVAVSENAKQAEFDPYHKWLGIPPDEQPPTHYRLLGLQAFESDTDAILSAVMRQSAHLKTYQLGKHAALTQKLLNEVSAAKVCLMVAEKKGAYDAQLRQQLQAREKASRVHVIPVAEPLRPAAAPAPALTKAVPLAHPEVLPDEPVKPTADSGQRDSRQPDSGLADVIDDIQKTARPAGRKAKTQLPSSKGTAKPSSKPRATLLPQSPQGHLLLAGGAAALSAVVLLSVVLIAMRPPDRTDPDHSKNGAPKPVASTTANTKPTGNDSGSSPANPKGIAEILRVPTDMKFDVKPLSDVIDDIKNRYRIEIEFDTDVETGEAVTVELKDVPLGQALKEILAPLGLKYEIRGKSLLITASERKSTPLPKPVPSPDPSPAPPPQPLAVRAGAFKADAASKMQDTANCNEIAEKGMELIQEAQVSGESALAKELARIVLIAARKSGDGDLINKTTLRLIEMQLNK